MKFVGGDVQGEFVEQVRGRDPERCLVVPIDVGKHQAEVLVADLYGQVVAGPMTFRLDRPGVAGMLSRVDAARVDRKAEFCRMGVESCGHYHRLLVWQLDEDGRQVVELNPGHVKQARSQQGRGRIKTDQTDLAAMASLLIQGGGQPPRRRTDALAVQRIWVAHRDRQVTARTALSNQVQGLVDQAFPTLAGCWRTLMRSRAARVIIANLCDPDRVRGLGGKRLRNYVANRGVAMTRSKAEEVVAAAKVSLQLPQADKTALQQVLAAEIGRYEQLCAAADEAERRLEEVLDDTGADLAARSVDHPRIQPTALRWATPTATPTPLPPIARPGWPRLSTPRPAPRPTASPSAAKVAVNCAPRSSSSARAWPASTTTSPTTGRLWSHATNPPRSSTSPSAAEPIGWRLR